jgi:DDE_Tnp_1-associated
MKRTQHENLLEVFKQIPDKRRGAGQRHEIGTVLIIVTMGIMSGCNGYRALGDFVKRHRKGLIQELKIKKERVPSYSTIRRVLMQTESDDLCSGFYKWSKPYVKIEKNELIAVDGKGMKGTVKDESNPMQDFVGMVTLFCSKKGIVLQAKKYHNKQESEIRIVRELIGALDLEGVLFTMDAIHCQKNG